MISKIDLRRVERKMQRYYLQFKSKVLRRRELEHKEEELAVGKDHKQKVDMNTLPVGKTRAHRDLIPYKEQNFFRLNENMGNNGTGIKTPFGYKIM